MRRQTRFACGFAVGVVGACVACAGPAPAADVTLLREDYQVIQRDERDRGTCAVAVPTALQGVARFRTSVEGGGRVVRSGEVAPRDLAGGGRGIVLDGIPVGGPYTVTVTAADRADARPLVVRHVLVGDLWVLGGQSNMFGIDIIKEKLPALPFLNMLDPVHIYPVGRWRAGEPPIHRIPPPFAPFTVRGQHPEYSEEQVRRVLASGAPVGGIDCSYFFARRLHAEGGVPVGLIPCAMGGALAIWDPAQRGQNRYGFMAGHVARAGGRIKGVLFFQGEQDAIFGDERQTVTRPSLIYPTRTYGAEFQKFVEAVRHDFGGPGMPVIFAQVCRHHGSPPGRGPSWELIRDTQRRIPERVPHSHCVATLDLDTMDGLHLDYDSLKRVGGRMAYLALPYVKAGVAPRHEIRLRSVRVGPPPRPHLVVTFDGVTGRLRAPGRPTGFVLKRKATGEPVDWLYRVDLDPARPNEAVLRVTGDAIAAKRDLALYYAPGVAPYANVVDANDMAVPAFGPVELE